MSDTFVYTKPDDARARPLVEQLTAEYQRRYGNIFGGTSNTEMSRYSAEVFAPPDGAFVLLLRDGAAVAGGALMRYDAQTAEMKRIWTDERHRRQGLAKRILAELEQQAVRLNYSRLYLTTGFRQPEARDLYLTNGYTPLFALDADPASFGVLPFEKFLFGAPDGYVPKLIEGNWQPGREPDIKLR